MADIKSDKSEILHYDNPDFPVFIRRNYIYYDEVFSDISIHWHDELEFIYVLSGDIKYRIDEDVVTMKAGEGIFVNSRHLHLISAGTMDCILLCIIFPPTILCNTPYVTEKFVNPIITNQNLAYLMLSEKEPWQKLVLTHLHDIYRESLQQNSEMKILASIYCLWDALSAHMDVKEGFRLKGGEELALMKKLIAYIGSHYEEKITLSALCECAEIGKNKCTMLFQKYTNMSPLTYVSHYRLEKAMELLKNTDMSIAEVAYAVGFSGASYFSESMKGYIGYTPREFRRRNRDE